MQAYYGEDRTRGLPSAGHDSGRTTRMPSEWHLCGGRRRGSTVDPVCARLRHWQSVHDRQYLLRLVVDVFRGVYADTAWLTEQRLSREGGRFGLGLRLGM